jgi:hypothetical protein
VRLPLGPPAPEQKVTRRKVTLSIAGREVGTQEVGGDVLEVNFGPLEFGEGDEFVFLGQDSDAAGNWSEPPTERRLTPFRDTTAPDSQVMLDPIFEDETPEA